MKVFWASERLLPGFSLAVLLSFSTAAGAESMGYPASVAPRIPRLNATAIKPQNILRYCVGKLCLRSKPGFEVMSKSPITVVYGGQAGICGRLVEAINHPRPSEPKILSSNVIAPRRPYNEINFERLFLDRIFLRWTPVPLTYNDPSLYTDDYSAMPEPGVDAWLQAPYLNDGVPRIVAATVHGDDYATFTVDTEKGAAIAPGLPSQPGKWSDYASYQRASPLRLPSFSVCQPAGEPINSASSEDQSIIRQDGSRCTVEMRDYIHIPNSEKRIYPKFRELARFGGGLPSTATQFAMVEGTVHVLFVNTDFSPPVFGHPGSWMRLPTGLLIRVVQFKGGQYQDECLFGANFLEAQRLLSG